MTGTKLKSVESDQLATKLQISSVYYVVVGTANSLDRPSILLVSVTDVTGKSVLGTKGGTMETRKNNIIIKNCATY